MRTVRYAVRTECRGTCFCLRAEISVMVSWGDQCWTEASEQDSICIGRGCCNSGNKRYNVMLMHLAKSEVIYKAAARNLNPRQEQWESYVEFIQKGRRITELGGNFLGTSLVAKYRVMMSPRFWVICSGLKHGPGYSLAASTNKSIKLFNKN